MTKSRGLRTIERWTESEDEMLIELVQHPAKLTDIEIADAMARGLSSVRNRMTLLRSESRLAYKVKWKATRSIWTEADNAALIELAPSCSNAQIAKYLQRTESSVSGRIQQLMRSGEMKAGHRNGMWTIPFKMPRKTAILLAQTCVTCGKLRDADLFFRASNGSWDTRCRVCLKSRRKQRYHEIDKWAQQNIELLQEATVPLANKVGEPYTSEEYEQISDADRSTFELAISLGRTYYGIDSQRKRLGMVERRPKRPLVDSHWTIEFPNAMKALQEHFRRIGEPVPEELWEWNDEPELVDA